MEVFRYRPLSLGCAGFIISLFASFYFNTLSRVLVLAISILTLAILITIYLIKKKRSMLDKIIKYAPLCFLIAISMIISIIAFGKTERVEKYYGENKEIVATVTDEIYETDFSGKYQIRIKEVDGKRVRIDAILTTEKHDLSYGYTFKGIGTVGEIKSSTFGYDERKAYLDNGIFTSVTLDTYEITDIPEYKESIFKRLNSALVNIYESNLNLDTASIFSALLLGNDAKIDSGVRRDFSRLGISHILAISGMHITLISAMLNFILSLVKIPRKPRAIILILATLFFVALTGFSESCVRAGIMMCLFYGFSLFGVRTDSLTSLFLAVSLILIFAPFFIFSVSLQLSFLAMLGCIASAKLIRRMKLYRVVKRKIPRYFVYTIITSLMVMGFTMIVVLINFGSTSLLSPVSNLVFVPIFTVLIYFAPILLIVVGIPYLSVPFIFVSEFTIDKLLLVIKYISRLRFISLPLYSTAQIIGVVLILSALILIMIIKRKHLFKVLPALLVGVLVLSGGTIANQIVKANNEYITVSSYKENDYILFENKNKLSIVDASSTATGVARLPLTLEVELGYPEIEEYIVCDYSYKTDLYLERILKGTIVRKLYLPVPTEDEGEIYDTIVLLAKEQGTEVLFLENQLTLRGFDIEMVAYTLDRSERKSISFSAKASSTVFTYFGSSSYEVYDYFTKEKAGICDIAVFGAYGPNYKVKYNYDMPYLNKAIYLGDSYDFASEELKNTTQGALFVDKGEWVRIKLNK